MRRLALRILVAAAALLGVALVGALALLGPGGAQLPSSLVLAHQYGEWRVSHVTSVVHVQASGALPASQSGVWTIAHVSAALHVQAQAAPAPSRAALTSTAASATSVTLAGDNPARIGLIIYHHASVVSNLFVALAGTASTSAFTVVLSNGASWEMPTPAYTGAVSGIWIDSLSANARVTEITR